MKKVIICIISLLIANMLSESWREVPDYVHAGFTTWSQAWALVIYYFVWEEKNVG